MEPTSYIDCVINYLKCVPPGDYQLQGGRDHLRLLLITSPLLSTEPGNQKSLSTRFLSGKAQA